MLYLFGRKVSSTELCKKKPTIASILQGPGSCYRRGWLQRLPRLLDASPAEAPGPGVERWWLVVGSPVCFLLFGGHLEGFRNSFGELALGTSFFLLEMEKWLFLFFFLVRI